ncbi:SGNH/GDSL hydrolase family protein [Comamonas sp.]|uniref:SGNH/GDSL hydrolase family protein n=1 Tax=Comamonas sp. TaxID=34028 RepID=UPI003A8E58D0
MSEMQQWLPAQASPEVVVNENFAALEHVAVYGKDATTTAGLTWGYLGGRWGGFVIAAGTVALTSNTTNYLVVARATGVLTAATFETYWNDEAGYVRVYKLSTGAATVTAVEDWRAGAGGVHGGGGASGADLLGTANVFQRNQSVAPQALASASTIAIDASLSNTFGVTLTSNAVIANPTQLTDGMELTLFIRQDAMGGRSVSFGSKFRWAGGAAPVLSTAPHAADIIRAQYDAGTGLLFCTALTGFDATPIFTSIFPPIADDNITQADEGTTIAPWSLSGGSGALTQSGSSITLGPGNGRVATRSLAAPSSNDYIFYSKCKPGYGAGQYTSLVFSTGGANHLEINFGYDYVAGAATAGTISAYKYPGSEAFLIATDLNYSAGVEIAVQVDVNRSCINFWLKEPGGKWDFRGSFAYFSDMSSVSQLNVSLGGSSAVTSFEWDWLMYCRPNIVAIGDSVCAGSPLFNPDPAVNAGMDNANSTWQKHCLIYQELRNNLIVNKGVGSQGSAAIASRMAEATAHAPRLVLLQASSNDEELSVSQAQRTTNIQNSIDSITATGAKAILLNGSYGTSAGSDNQPTPDLRDYMKLWWDEQRPSIAGIEGSIDFMQAVLSAGFLDASMAADGVHPNIAGYEAVGAYVAAA